MNTNENSAYPQNNPSQTNSSQHINVGEMKLGHLLLEADIISPEVLGAAFKAALEYNQPLTTVLAVSYNISQDTLNSARLAQKMVDEMIIDRQIAASALNASHKAGLPFDHVSVGTGHSATESYSDLENLLIKSGISSEASLKDAKRFSLENNIPIGTALLTLKTVPFSHLNCVFECLQLVNQNRINPTIAIRALRTVRAENVDLRKALENEGVRAATTLSRIKIGDLLLAGRIVNERDMMGKIEESIATRRLIGSLLVESGLIEEDTLKDALTLQGFCMKDIIDRKTAVKLLRKAVETHSDIAATAKSYNVFHDDPQTASGARDLLVASGLVTKEQIESALERFSHFGMGTLNSLIAAGFLTASKRRAAVECVLLTTADLISQKDAIAVMLYCDRCDAGFEEAFARLGITKLNDDERKAKQTITLSGKKMFWQSAVHSAEFVCLAVVVLFAVLGAVAVNVFQPTSLGGYLILMLAFISGVGVVQFSKKLDSQLRTAKVTKVCRRKSAGSSAENPQPQGNRSLVL